MGSGVTASFPLVISIAFLTGVLAKIPGVWFSSRSGRRSRITTVMLTSLKENPVQANLLVMILQSHSGPNGSLVSPVVPGTFLEYKYLRVLVNCLAVVNWTHIHPLAFDCHDLA